MNDLTIESDIESANHELTALRSRATVPHATAADSLALGHWLLRYADREKTFRREALAAFARAYQLDPFCEPGLLRTIAQTAFTLRDWPLVEAAVNRLLADNPSDADVLIWRAAALQQRDDFAGAERVLHEALAIKPNHPVLLNKLALCMKEQARFTEAESLLTHILSASPESVAARFDLSELQIRSGRYEEGWANYESRLAFADLNNAQSALAAISAYWQGESLTGKTLVVYGEQGNGDCLWAMRFLPLLARRVRHEGGRVIYGHDGPLRELFERFLPADFPLESSMETHPDFHCGLMSVPLRLGIVDAAGWGAPYLNASPELANVWAQSVHAQAGSAAARLKVGVVWNGNPGHLRDARRSVPVGQIEALLDVPYVSNFALSPERGETVAQWRAKGLNIVDLTGEFRSGFDDVAALIVNMDLVVTIDSGPAHLAGALGVPTCLLIDCVSAWFWGDESPNVPWYDSIELFRQPGVSDWVPVIQQVRERIAGMAGQSATKMAGG